MSSLTCKVLYQSPSKAFLPVSYIKGVIPLPQNKVASAYRQLHFHFPHPSNCFKMNLLICCSYRKKVKSLSCVQLFVTPDYNLSGSSDHGISQARILEWVAISFSRGSSRPRDRTQVSCIAGRRFNI